MDPWFATGLAVDIAQTSTWSTMVPNDFGFSPAHVGWAVAGLDWELFAFGVNFRVARHARLGPFVSLDVAQLADTSMTRTDPDGGRPDGTAINVWASAGGQLTFGP